MLIEVTSNVYHIPERLKEIDPNYFVVFNTETQKFEVHHSEQIGNTLALNIPYEELDARTIELIHKNRIENIDKIIDEIDNWNEWIEKEHEKKLFDEAGQKVKDIYRYVSTKERVDTIPEDSSLYKEAMHNDG